MGDLEDEMADVVDEKDTVVGKELKSRCHAEGILHRSSCVIIFKDGSMGEMLLQRRAKEKVIQPDKFGLAGGHLLMGESYLDGARRELQEEMFKGRELPEEVVLEELFKMRKDADDDHEFLMVYSAVCPGPFEIDQEETQFCEFFDVHFLLRDASENPDKYTGTFKVVFGEYARKFL